MFTKILVKPVQHLFILNDTYDFEMLHKEEIIRRAARSIRELRNTIELTLEVYGYCAIEVTQEKAILGGLHPTRHYLDTFKRGC